MDPSCVEPPVLPFGVGSARLSMTFDSLRATLVESPTTPIETHGGRPGRGRGRVLTLTATHQTG